MTEYKIGPHDRLQITVWEHPELNDPGGEKINPELAGKMVQDDGMLYYPYVGNVPVARENRQRGSGFIDPRAFQILQESQTRCPGAVFPESSGGRGRPSQNAGDPGHDRDAD